jgi:signal recognition particle GTPase
LKPYLKNTQHKKKVGGMAQVVECLPGKLKALSSNPSTEKKAKARVHAFKNQ